MKKFQNSVVKIGYSNAPSIDPKFNIFLKCGISNNLNLSNIVDKFSSKNSSIKSEIQKPHSKNPMDIYSENYEDHIKNVQEIEYLCKYWLI